VFALSLLILCLRYGYSNGQGNILAQLNSYHREVVVVLAVYPPHFGQRLAFWDEPFLLAVASKGTTICTAR
jgi:hypothetical protein